MTTMPTAGFEIREDLVVFLCAMIHLSLNLARSKQTISLFIPLSFFRTRRYLL